MPTILKTKNSVTTTVVPTTLQQGELAVNITDKKMWVGNAATTPVQLFGAGADGSFVNLAYTGTLTGGTGVVNLGSNQFYKDANGQVGVGVIPNAWSTGKAVEVGGSGGALWGLASGTVYSTAGYYFNSTDKFAITGNYAMYSQLVSSDGSFRFVSSTATGTAGNNATMSERMRIDSSGNVLIGNTTDPLGGNRLLVQSAATANNNRTFSVYNTAATSTTAFANRLVQISANGSGADATIHFSDQVANNAYFGMGSGNLYFATGGTTERMRIDSNGNVAIGTSSAYSKFCITTTNGNFGITGGNTSGGNKIQSFGATTGSNGYLAFEGNDREYMRIDSSGNLLVGTTTTAGPSTAALVAGKHYTQSQTLSIANNSATAIVTLSEGNFITVSAYVDTNMYASAHVLCRSGALVVTYINQDANGFCGFSGSGQSLRVTNTGTGGSRTANVNYIQIS